MPKNKKARKGGGRAGKGPLGGGPPPNSPAAKQRELQREMERAEKLWKQGQTEDALDILEDLLEKNPRDANLLFLSGVMYVELGMIQEGLDRAEMADKLEPDRPPLLNFLGLAYIMTNHPAHALMAYRQLRAVDEGGAAFGPEERDRIKALEQLFQAEAEHHGVMRVRIEQAMLLMERGERAFLRGESSQGVQYMQQAITQMPKWAAPRNNLALYLWGAGQPEEAWETARNVLQELNPEDYQALANLTTQLALSGREEEARPYLERLLAVFEKSKPQRDSEGEPPDEETLEVAIPLYFKTAESLAALDEDRQLFDLLKAGEDLGMVYDQSFFRLMAAAAWNLGDEQAAETYWKRLEDEEKTPTDYGIARVIALPRPPEAPRWRVPYFDSADLVPPEVLRQVIVLDPADGQFDLEAMQEGYERYKAYYPILRSQLQTMILGHKLLVEATLAVLMALGQPEIIEALREFALGVDGTEEARRMTVSLLLKVEELPNEGTIRFWKEDPPGWQEVPVEDFPPTELNIQTVESEEEDENEEEEVEAAKEAAEGEVGGDNQTNA